MEKVLVFDLPGGVGLEMVLIHGGTFQMGSPPGETGRRGDERQHTVTLTKDFYLGRYAVTQEQYQAVTGKNPSTFAHIKRRPVETVSWDDAMAYCGALDAQLRGQMDERFPQSGGGMTDGGDAQLRGQMDERFPRSGRAHFTLPTEAQWEYACRAGCDFALYNGLCLTVADGVCPNLEPLAWYRYNHKDKGPLDVGGKVPNPWGLYDMLGNIHEWVLDPYGEYPAGHVTDPLGPAGGYDYTVRGGNWQSSPWKCRAARRGIDPAHYRLPGTGFRVALVY
ncbi:MAG: formylglycine-generating enzyme family protein [Lachnospiraceae bacterium]|nr:formylglycine-generating enzyme family protein [Lachnospiraceae bacterium]